MNLSDAFTPAREYFRRHVSHELVSNQRLVTLIGAAAVLMLLFILYGFWSFTSHMGAQLTSSKSSLARLQAEVTGDAWPKRFDSTQALKTQLSVRLWDAPTPGLAEAGFETWLRNHFTQYGAKPQPIQITRSPAVGRDGQTTPTLAGIQRMTAKVLAPFDQTSVLQVLADAAEADKIIVVDRVIVRAGVNSRIEMDISTFIRTGEAPAGAKANP